ncbi:MAG: four helix bundle protein [Candidatus Campbellbacteria bacterium]|nr:four helix bundle protein [Candidatus Campbellbacteria bacterium]
MNKNSPETFHQKLQTLMYSFVHSVYDATKTFPGDEIFGVTSQLRRATLSVALNYTEGYARHGKRELAHFLKISYGSLKESMYLVQFAKDREWISLETHQKLYQMGDEIGKMLWSSFSHMT